MRPLPSLLLLVVAACSSSSTSAPRPTSCDRNARAGIYRATLVEESGNCGPVASQLVNLSSGPGVGGPGCTVTSEQWAEGDCKLSREISCADAMGPVHIITVTRAETADASEISGTESITLSGPSGCNGTYSLDLVRQ